MNGNFKSELTDKMDYIVIDNFETLPSQIQQILKSKLFKFDEWYRMLQSENVYGDLSETINKISTYLKKENPYIVAFHATRLFEYEINNICSYGYTIPTQFFIEEKVNNMCNHMKYDDQICRRLIDATSLKTQNKYAKFFFVSTFSTLSELGFRDLYKYWGGESIYFHSKRKNIDIFEEISSNTYPCLIVGKVKFNEIDENYLIAKKILNLFIKQQINKSISCNDGFESTTSSSPIVVKIIKYGEKEFIEHVGQSLFETIK